MWGSLATPALARALSCCTLFVALAGCTEEAPVSPPAPGEGPSLAVGFYGLGGAPARPVGRPCAAPEYRQFDFWVGQWEIEGFNGGGDAGRNIITSELGGCAVFEHYGMGGYVGRSLNAYDAADGQWHQHWVGNDGLPLLMDGGFNGTSMVMLGTRPSPAGPRVDRTAWTPLAGGGVRQLWEISADGGETFPTVQFDGRYLPRESVVLDPEVPTAGCLNPAFPGYRAFDFTHGEWAVAVTGEHRSAPELRSTIAPDISSCLTEERLEGRAGYEARVFSTMRRLNGEWARTYVDNRGLRVHLRGVPGAGAPVLTGSMPLPGGATADVRATWETAGPDRFVVRYETSTDGGASWSLLLETDYRRAV